MKFSKIPDNYAPLSGGLVYEVDLTGASGPVEAAVVDTAAGRRLALLRFAQAKSISIDAAPFVARLFDPRPAAGNTGLRTDSGYAAAVVVEVGGLRSEERRFVPYTCDGLPRIFTTLPRERTLAAGEFDELAYYAPGGGRFTVEAEAADGTVSKRTLPLPNNGAFGIFRIAADDYAGAVLLRVTFTSGGRSEEVLYRRTVRPEGAVRLAWTASSGGVEFYTFPECRKRSLKVEKSRFYGPEGHTVTGETCEAESLLLSDYEPRAVMEALDEILAARRVWMVSGGGLLTELDAVSSQTEIHCNGAPDRLTLGVRTRKREEGLQ